MLILKLKIIWYANNKKKIEQLKINRKYKQ